MAIKHLHCELVAYKGIEEASNFYLEPVNIGLVGFIDEQNAIDRAKKLLPFPNFRLTKIWECTTCGFQEEFKEMARAHTKFIKKETDEE